MKTYKLKKVTYITAAIIAAFAIISANFATVNQSKQVEAAGLYHQTFVSDVLPYGFLLTVAVDYDTFLEQKVTVFGPQNIGGYEDAVTLTMYLSDLDNIDNIFYDYTSLKTVDNVYINVLFMTTTKSFFDPESIISRKYSVADDYILSELLEDLDDEDYYEVFENGAYAATYTLKSVDGQIADFSLIIPYSEEAANYQFADSDFYYNQEMQNNNRLNYIITVLGIIVAVGTLLIVFKVI